MGCGADTEANGLMVTLTSDVTFVIPNIDLTGPQYTIPFDETGEMYAKIEKLKLSDLTKKEVNGSGAFDTIMSGVAAHLRSEYDAGRITGAEYTKAYIALSEAALSTGLQFLMNRDANFWQSQQAQIAAITARVQHQTAKMQYAQIQFEALTARANYALSKMKLSTESMAYCTAKYSLEMLMPKQLLLLTEQSEVQRAQTMDTRSDGATPVTGVLGKQKDLYTQQITSYKRDSENKTVKLFTDAWITMKTMDEGLAPPNNFTNATLDVVLNKVREVNDLVP